MISKKATRLGLFGGTFNPIHFGHLSAASAACDALQLDRLLFIPAGQPPQKESSALAEAEHRYRMVACAIRDDARFALSDFEVRREGKSFTIDTIRHIVAEQGPGIELYFILGDDSAANLRRWKGIDEMRQLVQFVSVHRHGTYARPAQPEVLNVDMPTVGISSSHLRRELSQGRSVRGLTPDPVVDYIATHGLYTACVEQNAEMT